MDQLPQYLPAKAKPFSLWAGIFGRLHSWDPVETCGHHQYLKNVLPMSTQE